MKQGPHGAVRDRLDQRPASAPISSFGQDAAGNLYIVSLSGSVYEIVEK